MDKCINWAIWIIIGVCGIVAAYALVTSKGFDAAAFCALGALCLGGLNFWREKRRDETENLRIEWEVERDLSKWNQDNAIACAIYENDINKLPMPCIRFTIINNSKFPVSILNVRFKINGAPLDSHYSTSSGTIIDPIKSSYITLIGEGIESILQKDVKNMEIEVETSKGNIIRKKFKINDPIKEFA